MSMQNNWNSHMLKVEMQNSTATLKKAVNFLHS